jgi:Tol biopolymer transport system component
MLLALLALTACAGCKEEETVDPFAPITTLPPYGSTDATYASWSPDDSKIVFIGFDSRTGARPTMILDVASGNVRKLNDETIFGAQWSPDGSKIIGFTVEANADIIVINEDGTGKKRLTGDTTPNNQHRQLDALPSYSPDGSRIVYGATGAMGVPRGIYLMNADGTNNRMIFPISLKARWYTNEVLAIHLYLDPSAKISEAIGLYNLNTTKLDTIYKFSRTDLDLSESGSISQFDINKTKGFLTFDATDMFLYDLANNKTRRIFNLGRYNSMESPFFNSDASKIIFSVSHFNMTTAIQTNVLVVYDIATHTLLPVFSPNP